MGLLFKFSQVVLVVFDLERTYLEWHQKEDFWLIFCNFLGINNRNFVKNNPKFENKDLFQAKILWSLA